MIFTPWRLAIASLLLGFAISFYWFFPTYSADLMATWLAGTFINMGQMDQVYPAVTDVFLMYPPSEWRDFMSHEYKYDGPIYPFLYPPIWARLAGFFSNMNFWVITAVALAINCALMMATVFIAFRATKTSLNPALFIGLGVFFLLSTHIGTVALQQNQPQILVSFLLVLSIERSRNNAPVLAGLVLAIAAAIKIYPALFALFWLFGREKRAFMSFVIFGALIGMTSLIWSGWPLHQLFMEQTRLISSSVLVTAISFNVDAAIAQVFFNDALVWVPGLEPPTTNVPDPGWYTMPRPTLWRIISPIAILGMIALLTREFSRADRDTQAAVLWPLALILMALLSPISWVYYYIPAACFAPVLLQRLGANVGAVFLFLSFGPIFGPAIRLFRTSDTIESHATHDLAGVPPYLYQIIGVIAFIILAFGFWLAYRRTQITKP